MVPQPPRSMLTGGPVLSCWDNRCGEFLGGLSPPPRFFCTCCEGSVRMKKPISELARYIREQNRRDALIVAALLIFIFVVMYGVVTSLAGEDEPRQPVASGNLAGALCEVVRVVDGDTIKVNVLFPWDVTLRDQTVRCLGYDAWEASKRRRSVKVTDEEVAKGKIATTAFTELLDSATDVYLVPGEKSRGPYGRILATVICRVDGRRVNVADWMQSHGHTRSKEDQER